MDEIGEARVGDIDPEPLLPGEWPDSPFREDAQHWVAVYAELAGTVGDIAASADGTHPLLNTARSRYRQRLTFWRRRLEAMDAERP